MNYILLLTFILVFGVACTQASAPKTLEQNILENNTFEQNKLSWNNLHDLPKKLIGSLIMHNHPLTSSILEELSKFSRNFRGHTSDVKSAVFNSSGEKVLTASQDGTAKIWNAQTRQCLVTLEGHNQGVCSAVLNGAEDKVLTASYDKTAKICDIGIFNKLEKFFSRDDSITLNQAVLLNYIYEIIRCRRLVRGSVVDLSARFIHPISVVNQISMIKKSKYVFDFNKYTHLQKDYESLPEEIQIFLDPYVKKTDHDSEASTSSAKEQKKDAYELHALTHVHLYLN